MNAARVLVVDDNAMNIELTTFVLDAAGFEVASAENAAIALERIADFHPDLILMDVQMPGVDGLTLTRQLKSEPATSAILIIALTSYAMKGDEERMRAAGCNGYLSKPIDVATVGAQIRTYLGESTNAAR